jgi:hypothetical protein
MTRDFLSRITLLHVLRFIVDDKFLEKDGQDSRTTGSFPSIGFPCYSFHPFVREVFILFIVIDSLFLDLP